MSGNFILMVWQLWWEHCLLLQNNEDSSVITCNVRRTSQLDVRHSISLPLQPPSSYLPSSPACLVTSTEAQLPQRNSACLSRLIHLIVQITLENIETTPLTCLHVLFTFSWFYVFFAVISYTSPFVFQQRNQLCHQPSTEFFLLKNQLSSRVRADGGLGTGTPAAKFSTPPASSLFTPRGSINPLAGPVSGHKYSFPQ